MTDAQPAPGSTAPAGTPIVSQAAGPAVAASGVQPGVSLLPSPTAPPVLPAASTAAAGLSAPGPPPVLVNSPQEVDAEATQAGRMLSTLLAIAPQGGAGAGVCAWRLVTFDHLPARRMAAVAWIIAGEVMTARATPSISRMWREAALGGRVLTARQKETLAPFIEPVFGLPGSSKDQGHLLGHVSEWLWYLLTREHTEPHRRVLHIEPPKIQVTDGGGDGLVVYDAGSPELDFRLWEIKKHEGGSSTATTVASRAARQLEVEGRRYLAQLTAPLLHAGFDQLAEELVDLWIDASPRSGAGVAVTSSNTDVPAAPFASMPGRLPQLNHAGQLEGLLCVVADYVKLAKAVREYLWTAL
jgi:hypothetical protein